MIFDFLIIENLEGFSREKARLGANRIRALRKYKRSIKEQLLLLANRETIMAD